MKTDSHANTPEAQDVPWMKNLAACANEMRQMGYKSDFQVENGSLKTYDGKKSFKPADVRIVNFYRFEGVSDPGDNSVLYVIETSDGTKGTLADGYGAYASDDVSKFIVKVKEIEKKIPHNDA